MIRDADQKDREAKSIDWDKVLHRDALRPSPALRDANCVPDLDHQALVLEAVGKGEEPPTPKRKPCAK